MSSIDNLKTLLRGQVVAGDIKLPVIINEKNNSPKNCIRLFYTNENDYVSQSQKLAPYYSTGIQVTIRHTDYNTARNSTFTALEYINSNRKTLAGVYWIPDTTPVYLGQDSQTTGYVWGFTISMKGAK